jgi:yeast amino acid transporter
VIETLTSFTDLGTELVGVTVGEAQNPRKTVPRAIKLTFYRILFFYCFSVLLLGMLVPYVGFEVPRFDIERFTHSVQNSEELAFATKASSTAAASPFVVAIKLAGIKTLPGIVNGCICLFVFSAANSDLYIASRTLYGLASEGSAPAIFRRTNARGVPYMALGASVIFCGLAYMNVSSDSRTVFLYFVNLVTIFGLETWISILVTHIYFVKARRAQNLPNSAMPFVAPLGIYGSYFALSVCVLVALTKNFAAFTHSSKYGDFDYKTFVTG